MMANYTKRIDLQSANEVLDCALPHRLPITPTMLSVVAAAYYVKRDNDRGRQLLMNQLEITKEIYEDVLYAYKLENAGKEMVNQREFPKRYLIRVHFWGLIGRKNFTQASLDLKGLSELMNAYNEDYIAKDNKIKGLEDKNSWYETQLNRKHIHLEERKKDYDKVKKDNEQMKDHKNEVDRTKKDNLNDMDNIMKKAHANEMDLVLLKRNTSNAELEQLVAHNKEAHRRLYEMVIEELLKEASNNKETGKAVQLRAQMWMKERMELFA
ncbi:hypothetical protein Tco_0632678 [Tanacetum coccineum]